MADETPRATAPIPRTTRPMSEALLNEKVRPCDAPDNMQWRAMRQQC
jgi:hypothetical protein